VPPVLQAANFSFARILVQFNALREMRIRKACLFRESVNVKVSLLCRAASSQPWLLTIRTDCYTGSARIARSGEWRNMAEWISSISIRN
jgi:hypothetical protein